MKNRKDVEIQEVASLSAGAYFGELALLNGEPRTATVRCIEDTHFAVLTRNDFKELLSKQTLGLNSL